MDYVCVLLVLLISVVFDIVHSYDFTKCSCNNISDHIINDNNRFDTTELDHFRMINTRLQLVNEPLDFTTIHEISDKCIQQSRIYLHHLNNLELWALKIYDSSAKLPSSILKGNVNQLGDFDQCLNTDIKLDNKKIQGKYCLLNIQIEKPQDKIWKMIHRLAHSHYAFQSEINDFGSIIPRFSSINWGICVPSGCSASDVRRLIEDRLIPRFKEVGFNISTRLDDYNCQIKTPILQLFTIPCIITICFFMIIIFVTIISTVYDYLKISNKNDIFVAFSLLKNTKSLLSIERQRDDIKVVHGIRFFAAAMIYVSHKALVIFYDAYVNRTEMAEISSKDVAFLVRPCSLYTDTFLMLSGMLFSFSMFGRIIRFQRINLIGDYISRLFRLLPTLGAIILFCTNILPLLGSGPQWNDVVVGQSLICRKTWWRSLLFIANYFGFKNICLVHSHHIGIDTQLFFISPIFVWIIWKWRTKGIIALSAIATFSTFLRIYATIKYNISNYIHFGISLERLIETADKTYMLPPHRTTSYLIGVILGYYLKIDINNNMNTNVASGAHFNINAIVALIGFIVALLGSSYMAVLDYTYNPYDAAWFAGISPILLCLSLSWFIYSTHFGYKSMLSRFLSSKYFLITTRLAYSAYLIQFPMFFYITGSTKTTDYFSILRKNIEIPEIILLLLLSTIVTLLFELPFLNIKNYLFKKPSLIKQD